MPIVLETDVTSLTGPYLYSDYASIDNRHRILIKEYCRNTPLNQLAKIPLLGSVAGVIRCSLGIIHILGHLIAALLTQDIGHLYHALKGMCEVLRGLIEIIPIIGQVFACYTDFGDTPLSGGDHTIINGYYRNIPGPFWIDYRFWIVRIHNTKYPDRLNLLDKFWLHGHVVELNNIHQFPKYVYNDFFRPSMFQ